MSEDAREHDLATFPLSRSEKVEVTMASLPLFPKEGI
jgi:hypothetical protein